MTPVGAGGGRLRASTYAVALVAVVVVVGPLALLGGGDAAGGDGAPPASSGGSGGGTTGGGANRPADDAGDDRRILAAAGGRLWWSDSDCRAHALDLRSARRADGDEENCRLWPSPDGRAALATVGPTNFVIVDRRLEVLSPSLAVRRTVHHDAEGYLASPVAWSPDGRLATVCLRQAVGGRDRLATLRPDGPVRPGEPGCFPAYTPSGRLVTWNDGAVRVGDRPVARSGAFLRFLPDVDPADAPVVTALAATDDRIVVAVAPGSEFGLRTGPGAVVVMDRDGEILQGTEVPDGQRALAVGLSPDGTAAWYYDAGIRRVRIFAVSGTLADAIPTTVRWPAWSPDGDFLAAATEDGIRVLGWPRGDTSAEIPGAVANRLAWTGAPGQAAG